MNIPVIVSIWMFLCAQLVAQAQHSAAPANQQSFPPPDFVLRDPPHKEAKSGVQFGPGGQLTIQQGVGTPTAINSLSLSKDGKLLAAGKDFGRVVVWDVPGRKFLRAFETGQGIVRAVALSSDGRVLATGGNSQLKLWDTASGEALRAIPTDDYIHALAFDSSGRWLTFADNSGTKVLDVGTGKPVLSLGSGQAVFSRDGSTLVTANADGVSIWSTTGWSKVRAFSAGKPYPYLVATHGATDQVAMYQKWGVRILHLGSGEPFSDRAGVLPEDSTGYPKFGEFSPDGSVLFTTLKSTLWLWDVGTNKICSSPVMYSSGGALSGDGRWFAGAKDDSILSKERADGVWIWDTSRLLAACGMGAAPR